MDILTTALSKAPAAGSIIGVPVSVWLPPLAVLVVALFGFWNTSRATKRAGENSDASLKRTITADRQARLLEKQMLLYADILTFIAQRSQHRSAVLSMGKIEGVDIPQQYESTDRFALSGRAEAIARQSVLNAWNACNKADEDTVRKQILQAKIPKVGDAGMKEYAEIDAARVEAERQDGLLRDAIRIALHNRTDDDGLGDL
jgi:hypothetical protein